MPRETETQKAPRALDHISPEQLRVLAESHLKSPDDLALFDQALAFARERHGATPYHYGGSFFEHAVAVASILIAMKMDVVAIMGGLLHGVINEGVAALDEVSVRFGPEVANIVNGTTRIKNVRYRSGAADQAENIRKYILAMGSDIRVLLVRLADRLQDMSILHNAPEDERRYKSRETMDLYAPLAERVGIDWLKCELEELAFSYLQPEEYARLASQMESSWGERQAYVDEVTAILYSKLRASNIEPIRVYGRPKRLYSIYKKLVAQKITLDKVYDKVAFRIIVRTVRECYQALGTVHADWQPVPGRIKDFISAPKANNYQSLHTSVVGPRGHFIEIQIRTEEMEQVAQEGVAAHWAYKEGQNISAADARLFKNIQQMVQRLQDVQDPADFVESLKGELYEPDVFALTPKGEVRDLPRGSTPIDFAYAIHSDVGDTCVGARVNGQIVPLKYTLHNGDLVEILTQKGQKPKRAWLQIVQSSRARNRIRQYLRKEERESSLKLGRELCERELRKNGLSLQSLAKSGQMHPLLQELRCAALDDLLLKVGTGALTAPALTRILQPEPEAEGGQADEGRSDGKQSCTRLAAEGGKAETKRAGKVFAGIEGMPVKVSRCCYPIPGDPIIGFVTTGSGLSIHRAECPNLLATSSERWLEVAWPAELEERYHAAILLRVEHKKGILATVSANINSSDADIVELVSKPAARDLTEIDAVVEVHDLEHLQQVMRHLRQLPELLELRRR